MPPFKISTLKEREQFYKKEFSINKVKQWLKKISFRPQFFALDAGTETKIIKYKKNLNRMFVLKPNISLSDLKIKIISYLPEDVYFDRNIYKNPLKAYKNMNFKKIFGTKECKEQVLAFDIDSDNLECSKCKNKDYLYFCLNCFEKVKIKAINAYNELKKYFKKIEVVYSGRGFHIYVLDKKAYFLTLKRRNQLNKKLNKFAIDSWVSRGYIRLIRLPYTLNSIVSRIVIPISIKEIKNFKPANDKSVISKFLFEKITFPKK